MCLLNILELSGSSVSTSEVHLIHFSPLYSCHLPSQSKYLPPAFTSVTTRFLCQRGRGRDVRSRMLCPQTFKIDPSFRRGCQEREGKTGRKSKALSPSLHARSPLPQSHLWDSFNTPSLRTSQGHTEQGCQMAKYDPFFSLDCARVEGRGAKSKERKESHFAV